MADKKKKTFRLHTTYAQRQNIRGYLFMLPWILGFIVFSLIPFGATVVLIALDALDIFHLFG